MHDIFLKEKEREVVEGRKRVAAWKTMHSNKGFGLEEAFEHKHASRRKELIRNRTPGYQYKIPCLDSTIITSGNILQHHALVR